MAIRIKARHGENIGQMLRRFKKLCEKEGLTKDAALAMLTTHPASILGVSDQLGTIEKGKRANLVVVDGDIFAPKGTVRAVWIDGKRIEVRAPKKIDLAGTWQIDTLPRRAPALPLRAPAGACEEDHVNSDS